MRNRIQIESGDIVDLNVPVSIASLVLLPSNKFSVQSRSFTDKWEESITRILIRAYFSLIMSNIIEMEYRKQEMKFFGIQWTRYCFNTRISTSEFNFNKLGWIEQQFVNAISANEVKGDFIGNTNFKKQIRMFVNLLLSAVKEYNDPTKSIVERILSSIKYSKFTFEMEESSERSNKIDLVFNENTKQLFQRVINKVDKSIENYMDIEEYKILMRKFKKAIKKELKGKRFSNEYSG